MPKKLTPVLLIALLLLSLSCLPLWAQEEEPEETPIDEPFQVYTLGQQSLALSAGLMIPLGFRSYVSGERFDTNLSLGGVGSLQWGVHLNNNWMMGVEVGGMFSRSLQEKVLYMLPITAKGSYIFHLFPFEFPVFLGTGMAIVRNREQTQLNWIVKPGFSSIWKYNMNWGFGLNVVYWWVLQPWKYDNDPDKDLMGSFLELTLTAQYHF